MALVDELIRVLGYPKLGFSPDDQRAIVADLLRVAELVEVRTEIGDVPDDPDDGRVLACAVDARANLIVTGDMHLLKLGSFRGIPILRAAVLQRPPG